MDASRTDLSWSDLQPCFEQEGFPVSGAVDFALAEEAYQPHAKAYVEWIHRGSHGAMKYLERGLDRRLNPKLVFPELQSVIAVLLPYSPDPVGTEELRYARYLNGPDYHELLKEKLERVFVRLKEEGRLPENFKYKTCVDTSAVLERSWALLTGLGWIGKNTLLIHPQIGSYAFIGVVFTNATFGEHPKALKDYCGSCTRCIGACPTKALSPHDLNANECISYLTLEKRGDWQKAVNLSGFVAGCDLCQEVCPYNTKAVRYRSTNEQASYLVTELDTLALETKEQYADRISGTALSRIKYEDFRRNLDNVLKQNEVRKE